MAQIYYFLGHEQFQPEVLVKHAQIAESAGFDGVFVSEHFNPWTADAGKAGFALSTLGAIAISTQHIKLMTGVITPLFRYHPAVIAQAAATIDRLSQGRFMLGVGTGESINETALGYEYPKYQERSERMKEALHIMTRLFAGDKLSFDGIYYKTKSAKLYSPPLHKIPILLAAGGPKSADLAGELADGVIVSVKDSHEALENVLRPAKDKAAVSGKKDFLTLTSKWTVFAKDTDEAWEALLAWRGLRAPERDSATDPQELQEKADSLPRSDILSRYTLISNAEQYIEAYKSLISILTPDIVVIQTTGIDQERVIRMLGKDVLPVLRTL